MSPIPRISFLSFFISAIFALASCSNTKKLPQGASLYIGSEIKINDKDASKKQRKFLHNELADAVRPLPNKKIFGMRLKLRLYNFAGVPKEQKGFKHWLRSKVGEPPVLISSLSIPNNEKLLQNVLRNRGYFFNKVVGTTIEKKRKTNVYFDVVTGPQYKINQTNFLEDSPLQIAKDINAIASNTLLKKGAPYNLDLIKGERDRIDKALKEKGYYFFSPDYLYVEADTSIGNHLVDMTMRLKYDSIPENAYNVYRINDIYVYTNYQLNRANVDTSHANALSYQGLYIVDNRKKYRPFLFRDMLVFNKGAVYNRSEQNKSISRLINLNTFKFVKNRFETEGDTLLNAYYYLSAFPKKSLRFEIGANTQNDSRAGSELSVSWRNRNTFRAAEEFRVKLNSGFETQYTGIAKQPSIYTIGGEVGFTFPYFIVPFISPKTNSVVVPRTIINAKYSYESQQDLLRINSYKLSYGYNWKETVRKEHQLYPFNINYVKTDTFTKVASTATYANLLFNGLIIGPTYEFTYNSQVGSNSPDNYYFDGLADFSGIILGTVQGADYSSNPKMLLGQTFAQYAKFQTDFRYYHSYPNKNIWASRILIGAGVPFGNSNQLPNIKQFFSGGNSSLRGFRSRLVGPGTFNEKQLKGTTNYIQTLGDLKLEMNTEWRVDVYRFFKIGIFADAGNIWLYNDNPTFPGGKFSSKFLRELAADAGLGLRFDFKILLLRFDMAIPVRKPWLPEGNRWVHKQIDFSSPEWRSENLIFNLAIGYPF
ncbi:MAG: BamA/TamA family outer membrane protein [Chitinophagaceae bacterium]|nr:BamA/TamA family outer membrane protein [Chitinophagaceae bacterium]